LSSRLSISSPLMKLLACVAYSNPMPLTRAIDEPEASANYWLILLSSNSAVSSPARAMHCSGGEMPELQGSKCQNRLNRTLSMTPWHPQKAVHLINDHRSSPFVQCILIWSPISWENDDSGHARLLWKFPIFEYSRSCRRWWDTEETSRISRFK
jgi:hypothetical protein